MKKRYIYFLAILAGLGLIGSSLSALSASANPTSFPYTDCGNHLQVATTTSTYLLAPNLWIPGTASSTGGVYMSPGNATTTCVYDSYQSDGHAAQSAAVAVRFTASSTNSTLLINQEFSQDGVDWYQGTITSLTENNSTTTLPYSVGEVPQASWGYASSTAGLYAVPSNNNSDTRMIELDTPTRFTRVIFSLKTGGASGEVWAQIIPLKQNP